MKLSFKYSEREFIKAMNQSDGEYKHIIPVSLIAVALLVYGINQYMNGSNTIFVASIIVIPIILMFVLIARFIIVPRIVFRKEPKYKEEYQLEFLEDEILFTAGALKSSIPWSFYKQVNETKEFMYLKYSRRGFAIIPKRIFKNEEETGKFRSLISRKIK
ncbi:MAG: YcxB family protein [Candidatus Cohnella colombiensis]|uniref:YcxB family protein n=1 Tax=Candidatus Cohnella colombiensis TaxID=3121368 RepID=A0AA95JH44_9BACL|nr:MAG: YcxB family protein [Cohnella sp.]